MVMDQAVKDQKIAGMNLMVIKKSQEEVYLQTGYANIKEKKEKQKALPSREIKRRTSEIYFRKSI